MKTIRLQKLISYYGFASRRKAEIFIRNGLVKVDGKLITNLGTKIDKDSIVEINGKIINRNIKKVYLVLNKPKNLICSRIDELDRKTIYSLISKKYLDMGIFNVGRLDYKSKGLIILTNDGDFANIIAHPSYEIIKEYEVTTDKEILHNLLKLWLKGKIINDRLYKIKNYKILDKKKSLIYLNEGKKREIRILFNDINLNVLELKRIKIGNVSLNGLEEGEYRELTEKEIKSFYINGQ